GKGSRYIGKIRKIKYSSDGNRYGCGRGSRHGGHRAHRKAAKHQQNCCECNVSFFHIINFLLFVCFGLLWLPVVGSHFWPFTHVLQEIRRGVTRKMASPRKSLKRCIVEAELPSIAR